MFNEHLAVESASRLITMTGRRTVTSLGPTEPLVPSAPTSHDARAMVSQPPEDPYESRQSLPEGRSRAQLSADEAGHDSQCILSFHNVGLSFPGGTTALAGIDLSLARGELVSLVGPSGCGKTSVLRLAAGLAKPTGGAVDLRTANVAYVFQDPVLLPWRRVRSNIELAGELRRLPLGERRKRTEDAINLVGLDHVSNQYPHTLSGGMRMRVSLARALTLQPELFLLDEPFAALDEITRERLDNELVDLFVYQQFSALFVTHSVSEAVYLASRVIVLSNAPGRIIGEFEVPFGYPRSRDLKFRPEFVRLVSVIARCMRSDFNG